VVDRIYVPFDLVEQVRLLVALLLQRGVLTVLARSFLFRLALHVAMQVGPYLHSPKGRLGVWPLRVPLTGPSLLIVRTGYLAAYRILGDPSI